MAQKKAHEVEQWLARPPAGLPLCLVYGPDQGMVSERAARYARATGLPLDDPFSVFKGEAGELEQDPARLEAEILTIPMFADRKLVWIRNLGSQKKVADAILAFLQQPPPAVALLVEGGDLKKGHALRSTAERSGAAMCLPCYADDGAALDTIIDTELESVGLSISMEARRLLKGQLGGDRIASRGEVQKLALYCLERNRIEIDDVRLLVGDVAGSSADDVVDAVLTGDLSSLESEFARLEAAGSGMFQLLSALMRQFQQFLALRADVEQNGKSVSAAVAAARPPIFFKRKGAVEAAVGRWDQAAILRYLDRLQNLVLETRRRPQLASALTRQFALSLAVEAARRRR